MEIILYDCHWSEPKAKVLPSLSKKRKKRLNLKTLGLIILFLSFISLVFLGSPYLIKELAYRLEPKATVDSSEDFKILLAQKNEQERLKREETAKEAEKFGVSTDFSIVIPKIGAASKVVPNVDAADEKAYRDSLKEGVGHAIGTGFPGSHSTIYLFAHSTDSPLHISQYNAVFYLLKDMEIDDEVIVFYTGREFIYKVTDKFITTADDTKWLSDNDGEERLVLQTCWPPGTSQKRLLVIAKPV